MRLIEDTAAAGVGRWSRGILLRCSAIGLVLVVAMLISCCFAARSWADASSGVTVQLSPSDIPADGVSYTTATITVTAPGASPTDTINVTSSDPGDVVGPATPNMNGTWSATITSSTTPGPATIAATDQTLSNASGEDVSGDATLFQYGPAASVSIQFSPAATIVANGTATTNAVATVEDAEQDPVPNDTVTFSSSDPNDQFSAVSSGNDGTYTATVMSSTTAGTPTITATDQNTGVAGQAVLTQTAGPAASIAVSLQPSSIVANGVSTTTVTATVRDAYGNLVSGDEIAFSSSDAGELAGQTVNNHDGTYSAGIRSSTTPGQVTITATDQSVPSLQGGQASLAQITTPSATVLTAYPRAVSTNQPVGLVAAITAGSGSPRGTVTFEDGGTPILGCSSKLVSNASATCSTSFGAASGSAQLAAVFTPDAASAISGSTGTASLSVAKDATALGLGLASPAIKVGGSETYLAFAVPAHKGALTPTGSVRFLDGGQPISQCQGQPLLSAGGSAIASCTISYSASGSHSISAVYAGDGNFAGSVSAPVTVPVQLLGTLAATMRWSFVSSTSYTRVLMLTVDGAPIGSTVLVTCHGGGCPFAKSAAAVTKTVRCGAKGKHTCATNGTLDLTSSFAKHRLRPGAKLTVAIVRPGWIGKSYTFVIRARRAPRTATVCVAPGASTTTC